MRLYSSEEEETGPIVSPRTRRGLRGVLIDGVHATGAILTSSITGIPGMDVEDDARLANFHVDTVMPGDKAWLKPSVAEVPAGYPESRMFGWLPASGLYCRHVRGLSLRDVTFTSPCSGMAQHHERLR